MFNKIVSNAIIEYLAECGISVHHDGKAMLYIGIDHDTRLQIVSNNHDIVAYVWDNHWSCWSGIQQDLGKFGSFPSMRLSLYDPECFEKLKGFIRKAQDFAKNDKAASNTEKPKIEK